VILVLDTNVVVAGLLWHGAPNRLLQVAIDRRIELATSVALLEELERVLTRAKFAKQLARQSVSPRMLLDRYAIISDAVVPASIPRVARDPDDDRILACAIAGQADLVVSGDSDLLNLKAYQRIPIVGVSEALSRLPRG